MKYFKMHVGCGFEGLFLICRFEREVWGTRKWTRAVWLDEWSCKPSIFKVENHQHPAGTNP